jgi:hypothetical protein
MSPTPASLPYSRRTPLGRTPAEPYHRADVFEPVCRNRPNIGNGPTGPGCCRPDGRPSGLVGSPRTVGSVPTAKVIDIVAR